MDDLMVLLGYPYDTPHPFTLSPSASLRASQIITEIKALEETLGNTVNDAIAVSLGSMDLDPSKAYGIQNAQMSRLIRKLSRATGFPMASGSSVTWRVPG